MTKKHHTLYGCCGLIVGVIGGIAGTAFAMGAEKERLNNAIIQHTEQIFTLKVEEQAHQQATQQELDRFAEIMAGQITQLQTGIAQLTNVVSELRTDVSVVKALMERMESDLQDKKNSG